MQLSTAIPKKIRWKNNVKQNEQRLFIHCFHWKWKCKHFSIIHNTYTNCTVHRINRYIYSLNHGRNQVRNTDNIRPLYMVYMHKWNNVHVFLTLIWDRTFFTLQSIQKTRFSFANDFFDWFWFYQLFAERSKWLSILVCSLFGILVSSFAFHQCSFLCNVLWNQQWKI